MSKRLFDDRISRYANQNIVKRKMYMRYRLETISPEMLDGYIQRGEGVIIDLRAPEEYRVSHIRGAINVPYEEAERLESYPRSKKLILYCDRGGASLSAAKELAGKGFRTYSLNGGMQGYKGRYLVKKRM